ncbi:MAG: hypothetical protein U0M08_01235 [Clostridia bacterium]|mgnify:CR=1 FL=1|nr:hypothetical protein [Clostridia bacterium]
MFERLVGNDKLKELLSKEIREGTLAHGYIIEGDAGIGKHTLAFDIAAAMAGFDESGLKRIKDGLCPDIKVFGVPSGRKTIGIEMIRELGYLSSVTPNELDFKITIIENAEFMTVQAQNAFLKLLEEPPSGVYFLMLCENASALLPTVRSRAPTLRMMRCDNESIRNCLKSSKRGAYLFNRDPQSFDAIVRASDGRIGKALGMCGESAGSGERTLTAVDKNTMQKAAELVECIAGRRSVPLTLCINSLGSDRNRISLLLSSSVLAIRDMILCKAYMIAGKEIGDTEVMHLSEKLCFYDSGNEAVANAQKLSMSELMQCGNVFSSFSERLLQNGNIRQILTELSYQIRRIVC